MSQISASSSNQLLRLEEPTNIDTVNLYEKKSGIGIDTYIDAWLFKGYSYPIHKVSFQDSLALGLGSHSLKKYYIRLFNDKHEPVFEGLIVSDNYYEGKYLMGEAKFYKKGKLSHTEYWESLEQHDSCGVYYSEFPEPSRIWRYYKNGKLRKTKTFKVSVSCIKNEYNKTITTKWYSKKGKITKVKKKQVVI